MRLVRPRRCRRRTRRQLKRHVDGKNGLLYGVLDQKLGDNTKLTLGGYYQNQHDTPDPNGLPLSEDGSDLRLPRKTFLGANWNEGKFRKRGAFLELEHEINDDWRVSSKLDYKRTNAGQNYASLAGGGKLGGGAKKDGTLPLDGIKHYDHSGKQFAFQTNLNGSFNALGHSPRPLPHLQLQPRKNRRARNVDEH